MSTDGERPQRHEEINAILERKPGTRETRDEANRYTVVGAASRRTYANWLTSIEEHFVCHRNEMPEIDAESWSVSLTGLDDLNDASDLGDAGDDAEERSLSMHAIREDFPTVAIAHTMECAGNGRGQHDPETSSVQWGCEAVGTAMWTGTPLRSILRAAGIEAAPNEANDRWLTAIGGDSIDEEVFARSIPLSKALEDSILAYGMNGGPLPDEHGYPVRLIVPGWYGVNNVKWLEELQVTEAMVTEGALDRPGSHARWQQADYRMHPAGSEPAVHETIAETDTEAQLRSGEVDHPYTFDAMVMSLIGSPEPDERVELRSANASIEVLGVTWSGDDAVEGVAVSTDGGDTWSDAEVFGPDYAGAWRLFRYGWTPDPGSYTLCSRASDEEGRTQPARISDPDEEEWTEAVESGTFPWNEGGYAANAYLPNAVDVTVAAPE
ncbi:molybdopterin-binding oxidoreductase [Halobacteriales archaeon QS_8_65_32]|nr:MAG: molybdopterin-binding oxidoreductase [Halobacteriales archaeon QS_8_65_32]